MIGPGKYDDACAMVRLLTDGKATLVIVFDGNHGTGFSAQMTPEMMSHVPCVLRNLADGIDADRRRYEEQLADIEAAAIVSPKPETIDTSARPVAGDDMRLAIIAEFRRLRTKNAEWLRAALLLNDPYTEDEGQALLDSLTYENGPGG